MKKSKPPKKIVKKHTPEHNQDQVTAISSFKDQYAQFSKDNKNYKIHRYKKDAVIEPD